MTQPQPIHDLAARLESARFKALEELAAMSEPLPFDALQNVAVLQTVLAAVREEIEFRSVKVGGGAEVPLK